MGTLPEAGQQLGISKQVLCLIGCIPEHRLNHVCLIIAVGAQTLLNISLTNSYKVSDSLVVLCRWFLTPSWPVSSFVSENEWNIYKLIGDMPRCPPEDTESRTRQASWWSWVGPRRIDDLMEVWRQWAGRWGIWEAGVEGQDEIRHDDRWTPTHPINAWHVIKVEQKPRRTTEIFFQTSPFCHWDEFKRLNLCGL